MRLINKGLRHGATPYYKIGVYGLLDHTELLAHLGEGGDSLVEVLAAVSGRELYTDTSLILRYYGVVEAGYVDTLLGHAVGEVL